MYYLTQTNPFDFRPQTDENFYTVGPDRLVKLQMQAEENGRISMRHFQAGSPNTVMYAFLKLSDRFETDSDIENKLVITTAPGGYVHFVKD
jgi:cephalosporin hydroxylase